VKDNLRIICSLLILLSSLSSAYLPIKNTYASTDIYDLMCPFEEHEFDQQIPIQKPARTKSETKLITECPNPVDYICGQTEEYPVGSNQYLGFPTVPPIRIEIGQKIAGVDEIEWHDICDSGIPEMSTAFNTEMVCRVVTDFPYICLDARFVNSGCSGMESFYNYLKNFIDYENDLATGEIDEATIWYHYVNWMSGLVPNVIKNSGKLRIILEIWDSDEMDEAIPNDTQAPNCGLENINKKGLVYRQVSSNKIFTLYNVIKNSEHALISGDVQEPSNYYIRAKYCYTWQVKGSVNSLFREKIICSAWTNCGPTIHTLSTSFETRSARVRVSRPRSYMRNDSISAGGDDGINLKNCIHYPSRYYYPPLKKKDSSGAIVDNVLPSENEECGVLYYGPELEKNTSTITSFSTTNPSMALDGGTYDFAEAGIIYTTPQTFESLLMSSYVCGEACGCVSGINSPLSSITGDVCQNMSSEKLMQYCIRRNGIRATFWEGREYAVVRVPTYTIESEDQSDIYPQMNNQTCSVFVKKLSGKCFSKFGHFYIPAKDLALILGSTMSYYVMEKNIKGEDVRGIAGNMVDVNLSKTRKVGLLIWDIRARTMYEKYFSYCPSSHINTEEVPDPDNFVYKGTNKDEIDVATPGLVDPGVNYPWPFSVYDKYLIIDDSYLIGENSGTNKTVLSKANQIKITPSCSYYDLRHWGCNGYYYYSSHIGKSQQPPRLFMTCEPYGGLPALIEKYSKVSGTKVTNGDYNFRCPICNGGVGVDPYSIHMYGRAFDAGDYEAGCSILLDCPKGCVTSPGDPGFCYSDPSDKRNNGLMWGVGPEQNKRIYNNSYVISRGPSLGYEQVYIQDNCYTPSTSCMDRFRPVPHGFYELETNAKCTNPVGTVTSIESRAKQSKIGGLVQLEKMNDEQDCWAHLNCWPPARCGWGDGFVFPQHHVSEYPPSCFPCP
jgi:hypothetical protein